MKLNEVQPSGNNMQTPNKDVLYTHRTRHGVWGIWSDEDFSDGNVLLYNQKTGEDFTVPLETFSTHFIKR